MNQDDKQEEPAFAEYLNGNSELSRQYRKTATEKPPLALDHKIIAAAHRELISKPKHRRNFFSWQLPLAIASVVIICVSVVITLQIEADKFSIQSISGIDHAESPMQPLKQGFKGISNKVAPESDNVLHADQAEKQFAMPVQTQPAESAVKQKNESVVRPQNSAQSKLPVKKTMPMDLPPVVEAHDSIASSQIFPDENRIQAPIENLGEIAQNSGVTTNTNLQPLLNQSSLKVPELSAMSPSIDSEYNTPTTSKSDRQIEKIRKMWREGNKKKAEEKLKALIKAKPNTNIEKLKTELNADLVDRVMEDLEKQAFNRRKEIR